MRVRVLVCVCACVRASVRVCVFVCMHARDYVMCVIHANVYSHAHTQSHTHTHTHMHTQKDCAYLEAAGIESTDDLLELEIEDITEMAQALSLATKKRLTRFAQLSPQVRLSLTRV
jgi:uncharacterized protein YunC (DUF1805 family)